MSEDKEYNYNKLKGDILEKIGDVDIISIKNNYKNSINSSRTLNTIKTVSELWNVLEERDYINEADLTVLEDLLTYVSEKHKHLDIQDLKRDISFYKKNYDISNDAVCLKCNISISANSFDDEKESIEYIAKTPTAPPDESLNDISEIDIIIHYVSERINKDWKHLAVLLDVKEVVIRNLSKNSSLNEQNAAHQSLLFWKENNKILTVNELKNILIKNLQCKSFFNQQKLASDIENGTHLINGVTSHFGSQGMSHCTI